MKKLGIEKIQLPDSMLKVEGSKKSTRHTSKDVYMIVNQCFPSELCKAIQKWLKTNKISASKLKDVKKIPDHCRYVLTLHGLFEEEIDEYENSFKDDNYRSYKTLRNDASNVSLRRRK